MNARKHRNCRQAKETDRLGPKGKPSRSGFVTWPDANEARPVYRADLNHPVNNAEHGKAVNRAAAGAGADLTVRRVKEHSIGMTEEAKASGNVLDMPTSVWSEMVRKQAEPPTNRRKQMTTDSRRSMRPGVASPWRATPSGCLSVLPS